MTITYAHRQWSPIGAIELKSSYRRNMTKAALAVVLLFAAILGGIALGKLLSPKEEVLIVRDTRPTIDAADLGLPPALVEKAVQVAVSLEKTALVFAIPEPAPDADVVEEYVVMAPEDYAILSPNATVDPGSLAWFHSGLLCRYRHFSGTRRVRTLRRGSDGYLAANAEIPRNGSESGALKAKYRWKS